MADLLGTGPILPGSAMTAMDYSRGSVSGQPTLSQEQMTQLGERVFNETNQGFNLGRTRTQVAVGTVIGTGVNLADDIWSSPLNPVTHLTKGGDEGAVWSLASAEMQRFNAENRDLLETTSGVAGVALTLTVGDKFISKGARFLLGAKTGLTETKLWTAAAGWEERSREALMVSQRQGLVARESVGLLNSQVGRNYLAAKVTANVTEAIRQEALLYGVLWNNELVRSEDVSENAFWSAVGIGLGATGGMIQARAALRKGATSAETRSALSDALPMAGMSDQLSRGIDVTETKKMKALGYVQQDSIEVTQALVASRANQNLDTPANLITQKNHARDAAKQLAVDSLERVLTRRIPGVEVVRETVSKTPEARYIIEEVGSRDTHVVHGVSSMGFTAGGISESIASRTEWLTTRAEEAAKKAKSKIGRIAVEGRKEVTRIRNLSKEQAMVFVNGRWVSPQSPLVRHAERFDQKAAKAKMQFDDGKQSIRIKLPTKGEVVIDPSLRISKVGKAGESLEFLNYAKLSPADQLHVQEGASALIRKLAAAKDKAQFVVTDKSASDWFALDMAEQIVEAGGKIKFDPTSRIQTLRQLQRESLRLKAGAAINEVGPTGVLTDEVRLRYNLPEPTQMERLEDPNGQVMMNWLKAASSKQQTVGELRAALDKMRAVEGLDLMPANGGAGNKLHGDMLKWNRDKNGIFMRPILGYHNPPEMIEQISKRGHEEMAQLRTMEKTQILMDMQGDTYAGNVARQLVADPAMNEARKVNELANEQSTGLGSRIGQALGEFLPNRFRHRNNSTILSVSRLRESAMRMADMQFDRMMKATGMRNVVTQMDTPKKAALHAMLDEYYSLAGKWQIGGTVEVQPGWFAFQLSDTKQNRKILGVDKITDGMFAMNDRLGKPIMVSLEGLDAIKSVEKIHGELLRSQNVIRKARGYREIPFRPFFVAAPDTRGKFVGFLFDENNNVVHGNAIVAHSQDEYDALVKRAIEENPNGWSVRSREMLASTRTVWDENAMDWIHQGYSSATAGIGEKTGGLTGAYVKQGAFIEQLEWIKRQTRQQADETLQTLMSEPLRLAKIRAVVEDPRRISAGGGIDGKVVTRNIFDEYEQAMTGGSFAYRESAVLSKPVAAFEKSIDSVLASSGIHTSVSHVLDMARRFGMDPTTLGQKKTYLQIAETMGKHSPYKDYTDFLESQGHRMPVTIRGIANKINTLATDVVLRWDPAAAHATMNMLGLIPTLTAGLKAGSAPMTLEMSVKGRRVGFVDSVKIVRDAISDLLPKNKKQNADWDWMVAHGDASQSTFEYRQSLGAIESQAGFFKWAEQIDKHLAWASDGSENLSRQISHLTGLRLADLHSIKGMEARHAFAREFANAAIADYTPTNRPELYNTALGSVFGLFQSYVVSQYNKMFHWIEDANYAAAGTQAAWQASLFGLGNTYGVGALLGLHENVFNETDSPSLVDQAYHRFGPTIGSALMTGGFGALTDIALWTRGDVNIRVPMMNGQAPAGVDVLNRFAKMFTGVVKESLEQGPIDAMPAMLELVQREMPNRMLKGMLAVAFMDGKETDRFGAVMTETRTTMDMLARLAGVRSARMQQELEVFYANASDMDRDTARAETVRHRMRVDMRTADRNGTKINPADYFDDYVAAGGNPRRFKTWLKQNMEDAVTVRSARQLRANLETPRNQKALWRYGAYGAWGIEDGTTPEK